MTGYLISFHRTSFMSGLNVYFLFATDMALFLPSIVIFSSQFILLTDIALHIGRREVPYGDSYNAAGGRTPG